MHDLFKVQLEHLTRLALTPGFKDYSWHRAKELEAAHGVEFLGLCEALKTSVLQSREKPD
jgi:hypothetical protein